MSLDRTIVIRDDRTAAAAISLINGNWRALEASGHPMAIRAYEHKQRASDEQRAIMWVRLGEIAEQVWIDGRNYTPDIWHQYCKEKFLPNEDGPSKSALKGYRKWDYLPNGERRLIGSTEKLTTYGKAEYQDRIEQFAAENGVKMSVNPHA